MLKHFTKLPFFKRLIPSISIRILKLLKRNRGYYKIGKINYFLDFLDPIDRNIILNKNYENDQVSFLEQIMRTYSFSHFIDIGSNSGYYSFYFAEKFKSLKVKAFEINTEAYEKFNKTLKKNFLNNIEIYNFGLSDEEKKVKIRSMIKNGFVQSNSAVLDNSHNFDISYFKIKEADVKIGDNVLNFKNENLSIKIDVEGHELYTLRGLVNNLKNNNCMILLEISDGNFDKINNFFKSINYDYIFKSKFRPDYLYTNIRSYK